MHLPNQNHSRQSRRTLLKAAGATAATIPFLRADSDKREGQDWDEKRLSPAVYQAALNSLLPAVAYKRINHRLQPAHYHNIATSLTTLFDHLHEIGAFPSLEKLLANHGDFVLNGDYRSLDMAPVVQAFAKYGFKGVDPAQLHQQMLDIPYAQKVFMYRYVRQYGMKAVMHANAIRFRNLAAMETARLLAPFPGLTKVQTGFGCDPLNDPCCSPLTYFGGGGSGVTGDVTFLQQQQQIQFAAAGTALAGGMWAGAGWVLSNITPVAGTTITCPACGIGIGLGLIGGLIGVLVTSVPALPPGDAIAGQGYPWIP